MNNKRITVILCNIVPPIIEEIAKKLNISEIDAIKEFFASKVYSSLEKEETWVWHFSPLAIANMFFEDREKGIFEFPEEL